MTNTAFTEIDKAVTHDGLTLRGTLCLPETATEKPTAVVLMLAGSGEVDRNSNGARLQLNIFSALAHALAAENIASFRYDKRGCAESDGNYPETGYFDLVDDARAVLTDLRRWSEVVGAPLILLGHSEGTLLASTLSRESHGVAGQVLLTPFLEKTEHLIERQLARTVDELKAMSGFKGLMVKLFLFISGDQVAKQRKIMKRIKRSNDPTLKIKRTLVNAKWLRDHQQVDPETVHRGVTVPTLSIGGSKDLQCLPADAERLNTLIDAPVEAHILDDLTHILREDRQQPSTFRYRELSEQPVDARVSRLIINWIKKTALPQAV